MWLLDGQYLYTAHRQVLSEIVGVAKDWMTLGILLDLDYQALQVIEANHPKDARRCLAEVIHSWLKGNGSDVSWSVLCDALSDKLVNQSKLATDIELKYVLCID